MFGYEKRTQFCQTELFLIYEIQNIRPTDKKLTGKFSTLHYLESLTGANFRDKNFREFSKFTYIYTNYSCETFRFCNSK